MLTLSESSVWLAPADAACRVPVGHRAPIAHVTADVHVLGGKNLLEVAQSYFDQADLEDAAAASGELVVVNTRIRSRGREYRIPSGLIGL